MAKMLVYGTKIPFLGRGVVACGKSRPNILLSIVMESLVLTPRAHFKKGGHKGGINK